jgi:hypothetical protein
VASQIRIHPCTTTRDLFKRELLETIFFYEEASLHLPLGEHETEELLVERFLHDQLAEDEPEIEKNHLEVVELQGLQELEIQ